MSIGESIEEIFKLVGGDKNAPHPLIENTLLTQQPDLNTLSEKINDAAKNKKPEENTKKETKKKSEKNTEKETKKKPLTPEQEKAKRAQTDTNNPFTYITNDQGQRVAVALNDKQNGWEMFEELVMIVMSVFNPDIAEKLALKKMFNENKQDPENERARTADQADIINPHNAAIGEGAAPHSSSPFKTLSALKELAPAAYEKAEKLVVPLFAVILDTESNGDLNVLNDYRSRLPSQSGNGPFNGLKPGDTTPGGLTVPDTTQSTMKDIMAFQTRYNDEQKNYRDKNFPYGIPYPIADKKITSISAQEAKTYVTGREDEINNNIEQLKASTGATASEEEIKRYLGAKANGGEGVFRSTAIAAFQFTLTRNNDLLNKYYQYISEDMKLDAAGQEKLAIVSLLDICKRTSTQIKNNNLDPKQAADLFNKNIGNEWEGWENALDENKNAIINALSADPKGISQISQIAQSMLGPPSQG